MKNFLFLLSLVTLMVACKNHQNNVPSENLNSGMHRGKAKEILQTNEYTYLLLTGNSNDQWVAVPKMEAEKGLIYYYKDGLEMPGFTSKELNRQFNSVLFLESVYTTPPASNAPVAAMSQPHGAVTTEKQDIDIAAEKGVIPLSQLFADPSAYTEKTVRVKGKVTKYNPAIMNKNWIHIQDGTEYNGKFDLTVTSVQEFKTGDIVMLEGKIALNKNFGYGYKYEVLLEDAVAVK